MFCSFPKGTFGVIICVRNLSIDACVIFSIAVVNRLVALSGKFFHEDFLYQMHVCDCTEYSPITSNYILNGQELG